MVIQGRQPSSLDQVESHLEQLPVTGRDHSVHRQVQGEPKAQRRLATNWSRSLLTAATSSAAFGLNTWMRTPTPSYFASLGNWLTPEVYIANGH